MIRVILLKCLLCICITSVSGQQALRMRPADQIMVDLFSDYWVNLPDHINAKPINRGINISLLHDMPLGTSNFSIAIGMGFTGHNLYSDHLYIFDETGFGFSPITTDYSSNKISLNYLHVPLEFRFRSGPRNRAFRSLQL